ncbi:ABC transporter permease [bacterium]|nr:ABC transporter permease [candidate division CSSED10-310 bacterium]
MDIYDFTGRRQLDDPRRRSIYLQILKQLVLKNVRTRYKNSILGFFWSLLNPLVMMLVLYMVFSQILKIKGIGDIDNFAIFMLCGLLPWNYFSSALMDSAKAIVINPNLIKQAQVPRTVLPIAAVLSNLVTFILTFSVFGAFIAVLTIFGLIRLHVADSLIAVPIALVIQTLMLCGFGLFLSAATVKFRDIEHILEVILPFWFYLTPIFYPMSFVQEHFRWLFALNPMAFHVLLFRAAFLSTPLPDLWMAMGSLATAVVVLLLGGYVFYVLEPSFAERI